MTETTNAKRLPLIKRLRRQLVDAFIAVLAVPSGAVLRRARRAWPYMPITRKALRMVGVFPLREHFYEPVVHAEDLRRPLGQDRVIPGLDLNAAGQLDFIKQFNFADELREFPLKDESGTGKRKFYYHNGSFEGADAGFLYSMIRRFRPKRIIEIGGGFSTLVINKALERNKADDASHACRHICVEPYLQPWLEEVGAEIVRQKIELCDLTLFDQLESGDILFVDSSHVVRPQGDVLFEILEVFGRLKPGVFVHIHDVFTPRDYPEQWVLVDQRLWSEQYVLEAFLAFNSSFRILGALNYLYYNHNSELLAACPISGTGPNADPRSFWIQRV
jgi:hypothetical protein